MALATRRPPELEGGQRTRSNSAHNKAPEGYDLYKPVKTFAAGPGAPVTVTVTNAETATAPKPDPSGEPTDKPTPTPSTTCSLSTWRAEAELTGWVVKEWRAFWVPRARVGVPVRNEAPAGWEDLAKREEPVGVRPGDPILLAPDYRADELVGLYFGSRPFAGYTLETKRNYATDLCLFFNFL